LRQKYFSIRNLMRGDDSLKFWKVIGHQTRSGSSDSGCRTPGSGNRSDRSETSTGPGPLVQTSSWSFQALDQSIKTVSKLVMQF
jgi:hypothetical protein